MERTLEKSAASVLIPPIAITDGELLMRFAHHGDEQAFAAIVEKHGRLVWAVCWQVLRHHQEIEDAFQSTFFILARRARSIRSCDSLCSWLYRVAYRTALRARMSSKARPVSDLGKEVDAMEEWSAVDDKLHAIEQDEQRSTLLEELQALPEKYQQVLALCYLEGKTRRTIADELGCSLETVKGRLARGRQVLRHRLIRRGVSLSLAMAAMTVPVKSATAAVTPSLIGLTVTGASAWAAGTLGAKVASGAGAAKSVTTTSAQVIHLAHQGTVAMTIASFAKPAVVAIALLGAVSATLAVDSADGPHSVGDIPTIDLAAGAGGGDQDALIDANESAAVTVTVAKESAKVDDKQTRELVVKKDFAFDFAEDKKPVPTPPRAPKAVNITAPVPVPVPADAQPVQYYTPVPVPTTVPADVWYPAANTGGAQSLDFKIGAPVDLKLNLKIAELASHVAHLQLESKELEIKAMEASEEDREEILKESRKKLAMAEAEQLRIQIEQQQAGIEDLKKSLIKQVRHVEEQARRADEQARRAGEQAKEAAKAAMAEAAGAAVEANEAAKLAAQGATIKAERLALQYFTPDQNGALSLKPGDQIKIEAIGVLPDRPIDDVYTIEPMGTVALGATYGRAEVVGLSVLEAEQAIKKQLSEVVQNPEVQVTFVQRSQPMIGGYVPAPHYQPSSTDPAGENKDSQ